MTSKLEEWARFVTEEESDAAQKRTPVKFYANDNFYNGRISGALWLLEELEEKSKEPHWIMDNLNCERTASELINHARKLCGKRERGGGGVKGGIPICDKCAEVNTSVARIICSTCSDKQEAYEAGKQAGRREALKDDSLTAAYLKGVEEGKAIGRIEIVDASPDSPEVVVPREFVEHKLLERLNQILPTKRGEG